MPEDVATDPFQDMRTDNLARLPVSWKAEDIENAFPTFDEHSTMAS